MARDRVLVNVMETPPPPPPPPPPPGTPATTSAALVSTSQDAANSLIALAGGAVSQIVPNTSSLSVTHVTTHVVGYGVDASVGCEQCFISAGAVASAAKLFLEPLPTWQELLDLVPNILAVAAAAILEQIGWDWLADILSYFWPDFASVWSAYEETIDYDEAILGDALESLFESESTNGTTTNTTASPPSSPPPSSSPAVHARRRLRATPKGRQLLRAIDKQPAPKPTAEAAGEWRRVLGNTRKQRKGAADSTLTPSDTLSSPSPSSPTPSPSPSPPSTSTSGTISESDATSSSELTWQARLLTVVFSALAGSGAPAISYIKYMGQSNKGVSQVVGSVVQTAPVVGNGIPYSSTPSWTATTTAAVVDWNQSPLSHDVPGAHTPATTCADFDYLHSETLSNQPEVPALFQPTALRKYNWLLDAWVRPNGDQRKYCPALDGGNTEDESVPDANGSYYLLDRFGRRGLQTIRFEPQQDEVIADATGGSTGPTGLKGVTAKRQRSELLGDCPSDPVSLMRTEIAPLCQESYLATGQVAPFTRSSATSDLEGTEIDTERRVPQLIVKNKNGQPLAGKYCNITDVGDGAAYFGLLDFSTMSLSYTCGPSNANGIITLNDFTISGGSSRELVLQISVDGVVTVPDSTTQWRFDNRLFYLSTEQPTARNLNAVVFGGNSAVYLLLLLGGAVLCLNATTLRINQYERLPMLIRLVGLTALLCLAWLANGLFVRHFMQPSDDSTEARISLIGVRDMVATRPSTLSVPSYIIGILLYLIVLFIGLVVTFLFFFDQYVVLKENITRVLIRSGQNVTLTRWSIYMASKRDACAQSACCQQMSACWSSTKRVIYVPLDYIELGWFKTKECFTKCWLHDDWIMNRVRGFHFALSPVEDLLSHEMESPLHRERMRTMSAPSRAISRSRLAAEVGIKLEDDYDELVEKYEEQQRAPFNKAALAAGHVDSQDHTYQVGPKKLRTWAMWWAEMIEPRAERRQRCARNYVRKILRGRAWMHKELRREQERINATRKTYFRGFCSLALGLPKLAKPHLPLERRGDFFYPERLWLACVLSLWLQLLMSFALLGLATWASKQVSRIADLAEDLDAMAKSHTNGEFTKVGDAGAVTPFGAIALVLMSQMYILLFSTSMDQLQTAVTTGIIGAMPTIAVVLIFVSTIYHICLWVAVFRRYKRRMFDLRVGKHFYNPLSFSETGASSFIGYQTAAMVGSTAIVFIGLLALVVIIIVFVMAVSHFFSALVAPDGEAGFTVITNDTANTSTSTGGTAATTTTTTTNTTSSSSSSSSHISVADQTYNAYIRDLYLRRGTFAIPRFAYWLIVAFLFQLLFNRCVFHIPTARKRDGTMGPRWLRFRFWYALYEYLLVLPNMAIGFVLLLIRFIVCALLFCYYVFAIDTCQVPSATGFEWLDYGFSAYVAMIRADNRYTNPIMLCYVGLIQEQLKEKRLTSGRLKVRRALRAGPVRRYNDEVREQTREKLREQVTQRRAKLTGRDKEVLSDPLLPSVDDEVEMLMEKEFGTWSVALKPEPQSSEVMVEHDKRRRILQVRWYLLLMLHRNPTLRNYRKHRLMADGLVHGRTVFEDDGAWIVEKTRGVQHSMGEVAEASLHKVGEVTTPVLEKVGEASQASFRKVGEVTKPAFDKVGEVSKPVVGKLGEYSTKVGSSTAAAFDKVGEAGKQAYTATAATATATATKVSEVTKPAFDKLGEYSTKAGSSTAAAFDKVGEAGKQAYTATAATAAATAAAARGGERTFELGEGGRKRREPPGRQRGEAGGRSTAAAVTNRASHEWPTSSVH